MASKKRKTATKRKKPKPIIKKSAKGKSVSKKDKKKKLTKLPKRDKKTGRFIKQKPKPVKSTKKSKKVTVKKPEKVTLLVKRKKPKKVSVKRRSRKAPTQLPKKRKLPTIRRRTRTRRRSDIDYLRVGDESDYVTATHLSTDIKQEHFKNFSHLTRSDINATLDNQTATITHIFDAAIEGHLMRMGIEYDDLRIFSYGVLFRPDGKEITSSLVSEIAIILQGFNPQIIIAEESKTGQNAIMINFGYDTKMLTAIQVSERIDARSEVLQQVYMLLYEELECDIDWDVWWDTDEVMY